MKREYHLTPRPNKHARNKIWYAWYWEDDRREKREHRSTGCRLKGEAEKVIKQWEHEDKLKQSGLLKDLVSDFFVLGKCPYLNWKKNLKQHTIYEHRKNLKDFILPIFGDRYPKTITAPEVEIWLEKSYPKKSASWKNNMINTFRIVLTELKRERVIDQVPEFRRPTGKGKRADAFTIEETKILFPEDEIDLALLWTRRRKNRKTGEIEVDPWDKAGLLFGIMYQVMLQAGMRPGEIRALSVENIYPEFSGIHIAQQIDSEHNITLLKKADAADKRERLVKIPGSTMELLTSWIQLKGITSGPAFLYNDKPVRKENLESRFEVGIKNAKIEPEGRRLVPYSMRFTYRSRVDNFLERQQIMDAMGHKSDEMSLHYLHVHPEQFRAMEIEQQRIEEIWG